MKSVKSKVRVKRLAFVILIILVLTGAICIFLGVHARPAETEQQKACDRAAAEVKASPHDVPLEGQSIDAAICSGTFQQTTPQQSQQ